MSDEQKQRIKVTLFKNTLNELYLDPDLDTKVKIINEAIYPTNDLTSTLSDSVSIQIVSPHTSSINDFVQCIKKNSGYLSDTKLESDERFSRGYFQISKVSSTFPEDNPSEKKKLFQFHKVNLFEVQPTLHQPFNIDIFDVYLREAQRVINNIIDGESLSYNPIKNKWINYIHGLKHAKNRIPLDVSIMPNSLIVVNKCKQVSPNLDSSKEKPIYTEGNVNLTLEMKKNGRVLLENYQSTIRLYN